MDQADLCTRVRLEKLRPLFRAEADACVVSRWLGQLDGKRPVVFVGAGFSKNARGGESMPLWADVSTALHRVFDGESPSSTDPIRIAEEAWGFDQVKSIRELRKLVPRGARPGKAHKALFRYPLEGIVTTNMLDNLLDECDAWHRVLRDTDLPLAVGDPPPLLYIHGHESDPRGWVFSLSDFDNLTRQRPAMLTRIRALIAERAILLLGVGLQDPTFDRLYSRLIRELGDAHPKALAISLESPAEPQRKLWEARGLSFATIRRPTTGASIDQTLARFLDIRPDFGIGRGIREVELIGISGEELANAVTSPPRLRTRVDDFEHCLRDRAPSLQHKYASPGSRDDVRSSVGISTLWEAVARRELSAERWSELKSNEVEVRERIAGRTLRRLPHERFVAPALQRPTIRLVDEVLASGAKGDPDHLMTVARWCRLAVEEFAEHEFPSLLAPILAAASWCTAEAARLDSDQAARRLTELRHLRRLARRFDLVGPDGPRDDFKEVDFALDFSTAGATADLDDESDEYVKHMRAGATHLGERQFSDALRSYASADQSIAGSAPSAEAFRRWLALEGQAIASRQLDEDATDTALESALKAARKAPYVARWRTKAESRHTSLLELLVSELREEMSAPGWVGLRVNSARYGVWRTLRDLEADEAPPPLQRDYVATLLDAADELADDVVLRYRLELPVPGAESVTWLRRRRASPRPKGEERCNRDRNMVRLLIGRTGTKGELLRRFEVFPQIAPLVQNDQLDDTTTWLSAGLDKLGRARWDRRIGAAALQAHASLITPGGGLARPLLRHTSTHVNTTAPELGSDRWPWYDWACVSPEGTRDLLGSVFSPLLESPKPGPHTSWHRVCLQVLEIRPEIVLADPSLSIALRDSLKSESSEEQDWDWFGRRLLEAKIAPAADQLPTISRAVDAIAERLRRPPREQTDRFDLLNRSAGQLARFGEIVGDLSESALDAWKRSYELARADLHVYGSRNLHNNPLAGSARLLGTQLARLPKSRSWTRTELLTVLDIDPSCLREIPPRALQPECWGPQWSGLVERIHRWATGHYRSDRGLLRVQLFRSAVELHRPRARPPLAPHRDIVEPLVQLALTHVADARPSVASAAVASLLRIARFPEAALAKSAGLALDCAATDPRVSVRSAAAYGCTRLAATVGSAQWLRDAAARASENLESDPYLSVSNQARLARSEPLHSLPWLR